MRLREFAAVAAVVLGVAGWRRADRAAETLLEPLTGKVTAMRLDHEEREAAYAQAYAALSTAISHFSRDDDRETLLRRAEEAKDALHVALSTSWRR
ncbi:hypothetical protein [Amycolatopsis sp. CA-230715]|uniref:hypothetical protein n=1 Tax=Amycolatopsis sp. CA-230715 TaxID=2745196 RepID=UPI001C022775|nr:hypothetical protein [Amycolatopsis sp. CA-230715]QWF81118.1 hypothetical protein HUW46_04544 [Amycolatopsis sp. CA-230715]